MGVVKAVQGYIAKIVNGTTGIKVLLLDNNTVHPFSSQFVLMARLPLYPLQQRNPPSSTMKFLSHASCEKERTMAAGSLEMRVMSVGMAE